MFFTEKKVMCDKNIPRKKKGKGKRKEKGKKGKRKSIKMKW